MSKKIMSEILCNTQCYNTQTNKHSVYAHNVIAFHVCSEIDKTWLLNQMYHNRWFTRNREIPRNQTYMYNVLMY